MAERDAGHGSGRRRPRARTVLAAVVVLALVGGGVAAWCTGQGERWLDRWLDDEPAAAPPDPTQVAPPDGLELPPVRVPDAAVPAATGARLDAAAVRGLVAPGLDDPDLGRHVLAVVAPLTGDDDVRVGGAGTATPASTTKVVTSAAALYSLGAGHTFDTTVVRGEPSGRGGAVPIVLVGGGDPFLASAPVDDPDAEPTTDPPRADVATLAARTARALERGPGRTPSVALGYDASLFSGPNENPTWEPDYVGSEVAPVSALWVDEGRTPDGFDRVDDPPLAAAEAFADALRSEGVDVVGSPSAETAADGARRLARVTSAPLAKIVERVLEVSDNDGAEVLLRHVGLAQEGEGSFEGGEQGVRRVLRALDVPFGDSVLHDGSGLSRENRLDPQVLVDVLQAAGSPREPDLRPVLTGLPVAGYTGSLDDRMTEGPPEGLGRVRAKTGTLSGVASLAGLAVDADGTVLVFALMADRVKDPKYGLAQLAMDSTAGALGACDCS